MATASRPSAASATDGRRRHDQKDLPFHPARRGDGSPRQPDHHLGLPLWIFCRRAGDAAARRAGPCRRPDRDRRRSGASPGRRQPLPPHLDRRRRHGSLRHGYGCCAVGKPRRTYRGAAGAGDWLGRERPLFHHLPGKNHVPRNAPLRRDGAPHLAQPRDGRRPPARHAPADPRRVDRGARALGHLCPPSLTPHRRAAQ